MIELLEQAFETGAENLALEEILLQPFTKSESTTHFCENWENPETCVVIGRGEKITERVHLENAKESKCLFIEGLVEGEVSCTEWAISIFLFFPYSLDERLKSIRDSYPLILGWVQDALEKSTGVRPAFEGLCDLCLNNKKFSGTAQARKKYGLLHHMTLLIDFDLNQVSRFLKSPDREPDYRQGRAHSDFITTLTNEGLNFHKEKFTEELLKNFKDFSVCKAENNLFSKVTNLAREKYRLESWIYDGKI